jgi:hypothetical protein
MFDLIASWMTSGGPLQELHTDHRVQREQTDAGCAEPVAVETRADRLAHRFARGLRVTDRSMTTPSIACCDAGCVAC